MFLQFCYGHFAFQLPECNVMYPIHYKNALVPLGEDFINSHSLGNSNVLHLY